jgi:hypothetical protein
MYVRAMLLIVLCLPALAGWAQNNDVPLQRNIYRGLERTAARLDAHTHTGLKPLIEQRADLSGTMGYAVDSAKYYYWYTEKIYKDHLINIKADDVRISIDPLFQFEFGYDLGDATAYQDTNRYYNNTRGFLIKGDFGEKLSFHTMFHETQALVPQYLFLYIRDAGVMPGQGRLKIQERRELDYGWSQANLSYSPVRRLNIQFGHGKHFVGHGYRSMLLSDNTMPAPYLKFSVLLLKDRLQYSTWHTKQMHGVSRNDRLPTGDAGESLFYWYRARFNHLSADLGRVQLGLFESTLFRTIDDEGILPFDAQELNPVIGVNTATFGFDGVNKSLVGADLRVKLTDKAYVYGQLAYDGRTAWQAGMRWFDVIGKDLDIQLEYNTAEPFMYMHDPAQLSYMHAGLPMAHSLGTSFDEVVIIVEKGIRRLRFQGKVNLATVRSDPSDEANTGTDLLKPYTDLPSVEASVVRDLFFLDVNAAYLFNPKTDLHVAVGLMRRDQPGARDNVQSSYLYLAVRTSLFNRYYDI